MMPRHSLKGREVREVEINKVFKKYTRAEFKITTFSRLPSTAAAARHT